MADTKEIYVSERVSLPVASAVDADEATKADAGLASFSTDDFAVSDNGFVQALQKVGGIQYQGTIYKEESTYYIVQLSEYSDADITRPKVNDKVMLSENYVTEDDDGNELILYAGYVYLIISVENYDVTNKYVYVDKTVIYSMKGENATIEVGTVTTLESTVKATVENVGTKINAVFDFGIPKGNGIAEIYKDENNSQGLVDIYIIKYENGNTNSFTITNGSSIESITGPVTNGLIDTYTITINDADSTKYTFTVTNAKSITSITGPTTNGLVDTYTISFNDGTSTTFDVTNGEDGEDGVGISNISGPSTNGSVNTYTITLTDDTQYTFDVTNGTDGEDGTDIVGWTTFTLSYEPTADIQLSIVNSYFLSTPVAGDTAVGVIQYNVDNIVSNYWCMGIVDEVTNTVATVTLNSVTLIQYAEGSTINTNTYNYNVTSASASANTLSSSSDASASVNISDGVFNFTFGIPQGAMGETGMPAYIGTIGYDSAPTSGFAVDAFSWANGNAPTEAGVDVFIFWYNNTGTEEFLMYGITQGDTDSLTVYKDFQSSLKGPTGDTGATGATGAAGADGTSVYFGTYNATTYGTYSVGNININSITWNTTPTSGDYCFVILTEYSDSTLSTVVTEVCTGTCGSSSITFDEKTIINSYLVDVSTSIDTITTDEIDALFGDTSSSGGESGGTSSSEDPIYGVSWTNDDSTTMTRTDDATDLTYSISSSVGTIASDFEGVFPWTQASIVYDDYDNKFVQMPEMYFRITLDDDGDICGVAVSASSHDDGDWYRVAPFWYSCYGGSVSSSMLCSVSGVSRTASTTRANFRTYATNNGDGYCQLDLYHKFVMTFLWWIEFATKNSADIMTGNIYGSGTSATTTVCTTGNTDSLSTPSGFVLSTAQMRWHYIEDFVGNLLEWIDGITWSSNSLYVSAELINYSDSVSGMSLSGITRDTSVTNSCIKAFGWDSSQPFLVYPSKCLDDTSYATGFCDYGYTSNSSDVVVYSGAYWDYSGSYGGLVYFAAGTASASASLIGGRLIKWLE